MFENMNDEKIIQVRGFFNLKEVGRGSMGKIYVAFDFARNRIVALKTIALPADILLASKFLERFNKEADINKKITKIENRHIPKFLGFHEEENDLRYMLTEYVEGYTLHEMIKYGKLHDINNENQSNNELFKNFGYWIPEVGIMIIREICKALEIVHYAGIVHCDIKPDNIMLDKSGLAKLVDFGLAVNNDQKCVLTLENNGDLTLGATWYLSPERVNKCSVNEMSDIFALGIILYEILDKHPFVFDEKNNKQDDPTILCNILDRVYQPPQYNLKEINPIIEKCLKKNPEERKKEFNSTQKIPVSKLGEMLENFLSNRCGLKNNDTQLQHYCAHPVKYTFKLKKHLQSISSKQFKDTKEFVCCSEFDIPDNDGNSETELYRLQRENNQLKNQRDQIQKEKAKLEQIIEEFIQSELDAIQKEKKEL